MNIITHIVKFLVAITFIFSGFVKLVDPLGSAYKFEEYFSVDVLNIEFLIPYALQFSIVLILAEIMLGITLLIGFKPKITVWSLFFITLIFLFLTWYSAYYNKVTDCGCFGDAVKLTPWETFYKNIALIVLIVFLIKNRYDIQPWYNQSFVKNVSIISLLGFMFITYYVLRHLPIIDFRAYAIGKNIQEGMLIPDDAEKPVYKDTWTYHVDGKDQNYTTEEKPWNIDGATFVGRETETISLGYVPPVHDFTMELSDIDLTEELLQKDKLMLIVAYDLSKSDEKGFVKMKEISETALQNGYTVYLFSASTESDYKKIKAKYHLDIEMLFCDETTLKTMIRSNPGIVTLSKGTITGKWSWVDIDDIKL